MFKMKENSRTMQEAYKETNQLAQPSSSWKLQFLKQKRENSSIYSYTVKNCISQTSANWPTVVDSR